MLKIILTLSVILIGGWVYFRHFEIKNIYFPTKGIEATPQHINLSYEDIFFKTKDNILLNGWFIICPKSRATLLFCHGNGGNISHRLEFIKMFHDLGLNVFIFDYRGYGQSQGKPNEKGTYLDAQAAYDYLLSRNEVNQNKIIIYGESLGSAIAIDLVRQNIKAKALITFGGFTSIEDMARKLYPYLPLWFTVSTKYDSVSKIKDITIPKLIIHSSDDEIVPFEQGRRLFEEAAEPKEFYSIEGGHNEAMLINQQRCLKRIDEFLAKYGI